MFRSLIRFRFVLLWLCITLIRFAHADLISDLQSTDISFTVPGDAGYSNASAAFNLRFTFKPAAIAYPRTTQDVSNLIKLGAKYNMHVAARSGGHSYIANGLGGKDGALVIDMSNINHVLVDPSTQIATIGPGARLGDVALALNDNGRAMPHGTCPYVGVGGHSGHGGYGLTSRQWGLMLDTIQSLEAVLADGSIVNASNTENPDLFWALRGASSSFAIVTSIRAITFPAPPSATTFSLKWDLNTTTASDSLSSFQSYALTSPNLPAELGPELVLHPGTAPGRIIFQLLGVWYGPASQFDSLSSTLMSALNLEPNNATYKLITEGTYIQSVEALGGLGSLNTTGVKEGSNTFYAKSLVLPPLDAGSGGQIVPLDDSAIMNFMEFLGNEGFNASTTWFVDVELYGGLSSAINAVSLDATAFSHRNALFTMQFYTSAKGGLPPFPDSGFELLDGMVRTIVRNSPADLQFGAYPNYIDDRLLSWQNLYFGSHYPKLHQLKKVYDPRNVFMFPTSIQE
ncbi:glucooligosaccharide oxidase [Flammula alnicola]|nr:glucooligosaccharide oxidase [Flammula alnicola]